MFTFLTIRSVTFTKMHKTVVRFSDLSHLCIWLEMVHIRDIYLQNSFLFTRYHSENNE